MSSEKPSSISNGRLEAFFEIILTQARTALFERSQDILDAWHSNIEEAETNKKNFPPLKLSLGATVDLEAAKIETVIKFTTVYQSTLSAPLPDPDQPEFGFDPN